MSLSIKFQTEGGEKVYFLTKILSNKMIVILQWWRWACDVICWVCCRIGIGLFWFEAMPPPVFLTVCLATHRVGVINMLIVNVGGLSAILSLVDNWTRVASCSYSSPLVGHRWITNDFPAICSISSFVLFKIKSSSDTRWCCHLSMKTESNQIVSQEIKKIYWIEI